MDYLTLGEKRSLARTHTKERLDRLLYDTNPLVVRNILENPSLTEPDVLKMASRRPNHEKVLITIYQSDRWVSSYDVKTAIVRNPYTPVPIALGLLLFLKQQDLSEIAADSTLHEVIMTTARPLLSRRAAESDQLLTDLFLIRGGDIDLVFAFERFLEIPDPLADAGPELRELVAPKIRRTMTRIRIDFCRHPIRTFPFLRVTPKAAFGGPDGDFPTPSYPHMEPAA